MSREYYSVPFTGDPKILAAELNRIFDSISRRLNHVAQSGVDLDASNRQIKNLEAGSEDADAVRYDQVVLTEDFADSIYGTPNEITVTDNGNDTVTLSLPKFSFADDRMYLTNVAIARALDRTSEVIKSTTTVENTTDESVLWTGTLAADALKEGNVLKVFANGIISNKTAADDITLRVYVGATEVQSFNPAIGNVTDAIWHLDAVFTVRSVGAAGSVAHFGRMDIDGNTDTDASIETINTTIAENITIKVEWDNAEVENVISIYQGFMEFKN